MAISVTDALTQLSSSNLTKADLTQLAENLSISAEGKVTVLYGQSVNVGGTSITNPGVTLSTSKLSEVLARVGRNNQRALRRI
ncbi:hypothetical protein [Methylomonas rivi]|uniref:Uncharacterized protein n=1 Tax=Methylomonas rivi TaxID=2952226 RepID=A0ABT1U7V4_9GAMM|nr:hypothetical protein [Methylomonas sp. WSC-6]MCQ8129937.1 hypothetical protein [Methylomonas sp. WSC-6]